MKLKFFLAVTFMMAVGALPSSAVEIFLLQPSFTEKDAILVPEVAGRWLVELMGTDTATIEKAGDNFYHIRLSSAGNLPVYEAVFSEIGTNLILDLYPIIPESVANSETGMLMTGLHQIIRLSVGNDTISLLNTGYEWFYENLIREPVVNAAWSMSGEKMLLTGSTVDIRSLIGVYGNDPGFFDNGFIMTRLPEPTVKREDDRIQVGPQPRPEKGKNPAYPLLSCSPVFPIHDGWLGGDGDLSVLLADGKILWIFSDSFVGSPGQDRRDQVAMISNSVAVMQCQGKAEIHYYWRKNSEQGPEPVFRSFTSRYKYWPQHAFLIGSDLYVILLKVAPRPESAPGDIFNFRLAGWSLAKIHDPGSDTPDQWNIELYPWSQVFPVRGSLGGIVSDGFVYLIVEGGNGQQWLARIPEGDIGEPATHLEYLTENRKWENDPADSRRQVLFIGDAPNSVNYYNDIGKWVMITGPGFLTNRIRMRTAPELTGPWSEERVIFECPEQTPGSPLYDPENFCYAGQAHPEFYDTRTHSLLITYDWNVSDFGKLLSNMDIYIPRVVRVNLEAE